MGSAYYKRFRMEADLQRNDRWQIPRLPAGYQLVPWNEALVDVHARTKFTSFCREIDAEVFPCLGQLDGCRRLMREIRRKPGFLPEATWLIARQLPRFQRVDQEQFTPLEWCGTIQGVVDRTGLGSIQNVGVVPAQRGLGLGGCLIRQALAGFQSAGLRRATLEVTADNISAIRLYQRLGFYRTKTLYKPADDPSADGPATIDRLPLGVPASQLATDAKATSRAKRNVVATMVSALVSGMTVAETAAGMADCDESESESVATPPTAAPLITSPTP
jgi:ribosomal protein S18 acetylase RimI-like enzyme